MRRWMGLLPAPYSPQEPDWNTFSGKVNGCSTTHHCHRAGYVSLASAGSCGFAAASVGRRRAIARARP
jgi:hypothetical protein